MAQTKSPLFWQVLAGIAYVMLALHCRKAHADWVCKQHLPNGDCIGVSLLNESGEHTYGVRAGSESGQTVWVGPVSHNDVLGVRSVCSYAPTGRCEGVLTTEFPDGKRRIEHLRVIDGVDEYIGVSTTILPDGQRLDCVVNTVGDCDGEAVLQFASKEILHGTRHVQAGRSVWIGTGRWIFPGGQVKECQVAEDGDCRAGPVMFWNDDGRTVGTLDRDGNFVGALATYDRSGLMKSCKVAVSGGCRAQDLVTAKAPPGLWQKPRAKKAATSRPTEIRATLTRLATVILSTEMDNAQFQYRFLACGDEIRLAYTLQHASRPRVPFKGQVWNGDSRIASFDDPGAHSEPAAPLSCAASQSRVVASLRDQQKQLQQHVFVDGSELWSTEDLIRQLLDRLRVTTVAVVDAAPQAPRPLVVTAPEIRAPSQPAR